MVLLNSEPLFAISRKTVIQRIEHRREVMQTIHESRWEACGEPRTRIDGEGFSLSFHSTIRVYVIWILLAKTFQMEEQFILRVPPSIAERIERLLNENPSTSEDGSLDLSFTDDGRTGTFSICNEKFPASLLDLPGVVESYKTYDDTVLIKTADVGQIIMVREEGDPAPEGTEYRHGLTPPMRDARRRRFRREPDLNPELVRRVEKDLLNIISGGTVERSQADNPDVERRKAAQVPTAKPDVPVETVRDGGEPERSDSDDSMEH